MKEKIFLYLKGVAMGAADIVPGVSGGSIALITGIYDNLIDAISSVDGKVVKDIFSGKIAKGIARIHWSFLIPIILGIATAILSMAHLVTYFLENEKLYTWSLFFGLIIASVVVLSLNIKINTNRIISAIIGAVSCFILVGMVPLETPNNLAFIFLCGMIAICAMILPGISGSYLLLILGKYEYIISLVKNPFSLENITIIFVFLCGCLIGILSFSKILKVLLTKYHDTTIAFLTGMMFGSLRKICPYTNENILASGNLIFSFVFVFIGIAIVATLHLVSSKKNVI